MKRTSTDVQKEKEDCPMRIAEKRKKEEEIKHTRIYTRTAYYFSTCYRAASMMRHHPRVRMIQKRIVRKSLQAKGL